MSPAEQVSARSRPCRILIAGTGGQGVITAARLLMEFFSARGHQVVSSQLHGMAQRGGAVQSTVLVDCGISPALGRGRADFVLGFEPVETARVLPYISSTTVVFLDPTPIVPYVLAQNHVFEQQPTEYPSVDHLCDVIRSVTTNLVSVDATALAQQAGSVRALNVVMLGCLFGSGLLPYRAADFLDETMKTVPAHVAETNHRAFQSGVQFSQDLARINHESPAAAARDGDS
jgi:indolepyruvate ferredoxin oxidoreductase beta subunit